MNTSVLIYSFFAILLSKYNVLSVVLDLNSVSDDFNLQEHTKYDLKHINHSPKPGVGVDEVKFKEQILWKASGDKFFSATIVSSVSSGAVDLCQVLIEESGDKIRGLFFKKNSDGNTYDPIQMKEYFKTAIDHGKEHNPNKDEDSDDDEDAAALFAATIELGIQTEGELDIESLVGSKE